MGGKVTVEFDNISNEFVYLENIIINVHNDILVSFHNKNYQHIKDHGVQAVIKGAHKNSMSSKQIKINTLGHTFCRINESCSLKIFTSLCSWKFIYEVLACYRWPVEWVFQSLYDIASKQNNDIWHMIIYKLKKLYKHNKGTQFILKNIKDKLIKSDENKLNFLISNNIADFRQVRIPSLGEDSQKSTCN